MADDVSVTFGASIAKLLEGVGQATDAIKGFAESFESLKGTAENIAEAIAGAFAVEKIVEFVESMAELGLQTERTAAILGESIAQVRVLDGIARLTGTSTDALANAFTRMTLNVQKSAKDAFNPAAEGLRALGLNARDLVGLPADQYFLRLSDAVSKFNPSLNLTNALMAIGGKGTAALIPMLQLGSTRFAELQDAVKKANDGFAAAVPGMADTHAKLSLLDISVQSLGARVFSVFKPAIDLAITSLTKFVQSFDSGTIQAAAVKIVTFVTNAVLVVGSFFVNLYDWIDKAQQKLSKWADEAAVAAKVATALMNPVELARLAFAGFGKSNADVIARRWSESARGAADVTGEWADKVRALSKSITDAMTAAAHGEGGDKKGDVSALGIGGKDQLAAAMKAIDGEIKLLEDGLKMKSLLLDGEVARYQLTQSEKFAALSKFTSEAYAQEFGALQRELQLGQLSLAQKQEINNKIAQLQAKHTSDMIKLDQQQFAAEQAIVQGYLSNVEGSWNASLRGMLDGTTTFGQAMKKIFGDFIIYAIEQIEKKFVFEKLTTALTTAFHAESEAAKTAATVAGVTERGAAETAGFAASLGKYAADALAFIGAQIAKMFAAMTAFLTPLFGPAAPAAALGLATAAGAVAVGLIKKFDVGTDRITQSGLAYVHQGESIVPAQSNGPYSGGGGGGETHIHIHATDAASFVNQIKNSKSALAVVINDMFRNGTLRPTPA